MPDQAPTIPSYGRPIGQQEAPAPQFHHTPTLDNPKAQKPLNSIMKKMMQKLPKGKMRLKPPKAKRWEKVKKYY